jgi:glycosyltransferase involved in cell wall biosynthesis
VTKNIRVLVLSSGIGMGGADKQILYLLETLPKHGYDFRALSLTPLGPMGIEAQQKGYPVESLNMQRKIPDPGVLLKLSAIIRQWKPDILHSFLFHANILARIARRFNPVPVQISSLRSVQETARWREIAYRWTDSLADITTQVCQIGAERYGQAGIVHQQKLRVIPNGVDLEQFNRDPDARQTLRTQLGIGDRFVWLAVGRYDNAKDYPTLIRAFAQLLRHQPETILLLIGDGKLMTPIRELGRALDVLDSVWMLGARQDVPAFMNAADAYVMSSAWEGMPNVILEAAASGLPIVATAVGGIPELVLNQRSGILVPPSDPDALFRAMLEIAQLPDSARHHMGQMGREHIEAHYDLERTMRLWIDLYAEFLPTVRKNQTSG